MSADQENFEQLRRLLALKKHEQPPPRYFNDFSERVINQIRAAGPEAAPAIGGLLWEIPALRRFWAAMEHNPILAGLFGVAVCGLLVSGVVFSEKTSRSDVNFEASAVSPPGLPKPDDTLALNRPLFTQPEPVAFPSTLGVPTLEARGSLFNDGRNGQADSLARPVLVSFPESH